MWSHRAYTASYPVRLWLMLGGTAAAQGSIRWWCRNHRIHHRYTDTPHDPYNARQGFFYSHFGWMLFTKDYSKIGKPQFDIDDLESDPMVMWQNKHYGWLALVVSFVIPTVVAGLGWGDWEVLAPFIPPCGRPTRLGRLLLRGRAPLGGRPPRNLLGQLARALVRLSALCRRPHAP